MWFCGILCVYVCKFNSHGCNTYNYTNFYAFVFTKLFYTKVIGVLCVCVCVCVCMCVVLFVCVPCWILIIIWWFQMCDKLWLHIWLTEGLLLWKLNIQNKIYFYFPAKSFQINFPCLLDLCISLYFLLYRFLYNIWFL